MKRVAAILYRQSRRMPLLLLLLLGLITAPASAANGFRQEQRATPSNLNANIYLLTEGLKPVFQNQINQQVANISNGMISNMPGGQPSTDQSWVKGLAETLIQPSATLTKLTPENDGLVTTVNLSMFPGDPKPISTAMLVTFSVRDTSTVQVSAQPVPGSPQLANGPLTTFTLPIGELQSINPTPNCGEAALNSNIQIPVTFNANLAGNQNQNKQIAQSTLSANQTLADIQQPEVNTQERAASTLDAYAEVPNSSLSTLASGIAPFKIANTIWTAQNFHIKTQNNGLVITSDISSLGIVFASTTTNVQPGAENGKLVMHVTSTTLSVFIFQFPNDTYNKQIEDLLNSNLGNTLAGKFTVNSVGVGGGTALPCAGSDSLILKGTTNLT